MCHIYSAWSSFLGQWINIYHFFSLFVCLWFYVPFEKFSFTWRLHHLRWRSSKFDLFSALIVNKQRGILACHISCDAGHSFKMIIFGDPWHVHVLPSAWQRSCHYLFYRLRSVTTGDRTPISRMRGKRSTTEPDNIFYKTLQHLVMFTFWLKYSRYGVKHYAINILNIFSPGSRTENKSLLTTGTAATLFYV